MVYFRKNKEKKSVLSTKYSVVLTSAWDRTVISVLTLTLTESNLDFSADPETGVAFSGAKVVPSFWANLRPWVY